MPWFIKHETFTSETMGLSAEQRAVHLNAHRLWVEQQSRSGRFIRSGYLVDGNRRPGGGGLLMFEAASYDEALAWVQQDPMIRAELVDWTLQEWIPVSGEGLH